MIPSYLKKSLDAFSAKKNLKVSKNAINEAFHFLSNHTSLPDEEKSEVIMKSLNAVLSKGKDSFEGDSRLSSKEIGRQVVLVCTENGIKIKRVPKDLQKDIADSFTGGVNFNSDSMLGAYSVLDLQPDLTQREKKEIFMDAVDDTFEGDNSSSFNGDFNYSLFGHNLVKNVRERRRLKRADLAAGHLMDLSFNDNFDGLEGKVNDYVNNKGLLEEHITNYTNFESDNLIPRKDKMIQRRQSFVKSQKRMLANAQQKTPTKTQKAGLAIATGGLSLIGSKKRNRKRAEADRKRIEDEQRKKNEAIIQVAKNKIIAKRLTKLLQKRIEKKAEKLIADKAKADIVNVNAGITQASNEVAPSPSPEIAEIGNKMAENAVPAPSGGGGGGGSEPQQEPDMGEEDEGDEEVYSEEEYPVDEVYEEEGQEEQPQSSRNVEEVVEEVPEVENQVAGKLVEEGESEEATGEEESFFGTEDGNSSLVKIIVAIVIIGVAYWAYKKYSK